MVHMPRMNFLPETWVPVPKDIRLGTKVFNYLGKYFEIFIACLCLSIET